MQNLHKQIYTEQIYISKFSLSQRSTYSPPLCVYVLNILASMQNHLQLPIKVYALKNNYFFGIYVEPSTSIHFAQKGSLDC